MSKESEQLSMLSEDKKTNNEPVVCLGMTFKNDEERRAYFRDELRKKLPELKDIEGFPLGEYEDIIALSDPPYYTACPNPWKDDFIGKTDSSNTYFKKPFTADVTEGKSGAVYNAHGYHTKVPYKAIMRYILHYTNPGDIVLDGFSGTGMTGVAARRCGSKKEVESLGYKVNGMDILSSEGEDYSEIGERKAVLTDLSPAAGLISYNYNLFSEKKQYIKEAKEIIDLVEKECSWLYEAYNTEVEKTGNINNVVWSDVFVCPTCTNEIVFWKAAVNFETKKVMDEFICESCKTTLKKTQLERAWTTTFDSDLSETIKFAKQVPVLINYSLNYSRLHNKS